MLMVGCLPLSSIISPQWPPSSASLSCPNGRVHVLLWVCLTTTCGQIDRMYIWTETQIMHFILWCSESCDCKKDEYDKMKWHVVVCCAAVSAVYEVPRRAVQRIQELQNLIILYVKSCSILNAPPQLQVLPGAPEIALGQSDSTLLSSRGVWEHLEVTRSTGEVGWSVWEDCLLLPARFTFCWCQCMLNSVYVELGVCWTRCMLNSVYAVLSVCCTRHMIYWVYAVLAICCTRCMLDWVLTPDHGLQK
jgi:hypothetical protein